jgi:hypothetical protein
LPQILTKAYFGEEKNTFLAFNQMLFHFNPLITTVCNPATQYLKLVMASGGLKALAKGVPFISGLYNPSSSHVGHSDDGHSDGHSDGHTDSHSDIVTQICPPRHASGDRPQVTRSGELNGDTRTHTPQAHLGML